MHTAYLPPAFTQGRLVRVPSKATVEIDYQDIYRNRGRMYFYVYFLKSNPTDISISAAGQ